MNKKKPFDRYKVIVIIMFLVFITIISRLLYLQVLKNDEFKEKADIGSHRNILDPAPRGNITDRNGDILATNKQSFMLTFTKTDESEKDFFPTIKRVLSILDKNGEKLQDDFELKIDPYRFEFKTDSAYWKRIMELKFKRDRGIDEDLIKKFYKGKKRDELKKEELKKIEDELLKITPEQTFNILLKNYDIDKLKGSYSLYDKRRFMVVKDNIKMQSFTSFKPTVIAANIKRETAFIFSQILNQLPGIDVSIQPIRYYPYGELGSAFIGYISKINGDQKEKYEEKGYDASSDYIGTAGIEAIYEDRLKGSKGMRSVKINKHGRITEELATKEPYPGQNIQLTIDKNVQYAAEKSLDDAMAVLRANPRKSYDGVDTSNATRGAAVAIDINTGKILALVSRPGYNPNIFSMPNMLTPDLYKKYFNPDLEAFGKEFINARGNGFLSDTGYDFNKKLNKLFPIDNSIDGNSKLRKDMYDLYPKPFFNYATSSLLPPGSTMKPLTATAGLEEEVINPDTQIYDAVTYNKNHYGGKCWNLSGHGYVDVRKALEVSCNYFFYDVGDRLYEKGKAQGKKQGYNLLAKYAWKFGLGVDPNSKSKPATGIEIPEKFGQVYNYDSGVNIFSTLYMQQLVDFLNKGMDSRGNSYKGINIMPTSVDSEDIKSIKDDLYNLILNEMKNKTLNYSKLTDNVREIIEELIDRSPELSKVGYSDKDINNMTLAISYSIGDCQGNITTPTNVYNAAIGQGTNQFTPLQLANYIGSIVNGGTRYKVHLVDKFLDADGKVINEVKPEVIDKIKLKPTTVEAVKEGMHDVTKGENGTASSVFIGFPIDNAGKTGSSTFSSFQDQIGRTSSAVYLGFAPYDKPEIAVCAIILDGGHGGYVAPVARAMYEAYFKDRIKKDNPGYVPQYNYELKTKE